jgi:hypothetical protein
MLMTLACGSEVSKELTDLVVGDDVLDQPS